MTLLRKRLSELRRRLVAVNLRSRSIRLLRTTRSGAFDLSRLRDLDPAALQRVIVAMGRAESAVVDVLTTRGGDEHRQAGEDLRVLAHAAHRTWMEVGEHELLLGWPMVEAHLDGTWLRAPLLLYPAALTRARSGTLRWRLRLEGRPDVNEVLTQTLHRLTGARLDLDALYARDEDSRLRPDDATWAAICAWLIDAGLPLALGAAEVDAVGGASEHGALPPLTAIPDRPRATWDEPPADIRSAAAPGSLTLAHQLVLGRFPQSSSNVLSDYNALEGQLPLLTRGPAAELLAVDLSALAASGAERAGVALSGVEGGAGSGEVRDREASAGDGDRASEVATAGAGADDGSARCGAEAAGAVRILSSDASQEQVLSALLPALGEAPSGADREADERPPGVTLPGRGLVVRGPPGTGKSQLIANLIGAAVERGASVLMVCQKRAALDVVAARLAEVGLTEPLAAVHDVHHDRASFCEQLAETVSAVLGEDAGSGAAVDAERAALAAHERAREHLAVRLEAAQEAYRAMRAPGPSGLSLAALVERSLDDDGRPLPELTAVAGEVREGDALAALPALERVAARARPLASPHPLAVRTDWAELDGDALAEFGAVLQRWRAELAACAISPTLSDGGVKDGDDGDTADDGGVDAGVLTPAQAHGYAPLWQLTAPVLDVFEAADTDAIERFLVLWHFTDAGQRRGEFEGLLARLRRGLRELDDVPAALFEASAAELTSWRDELGQLEAIEGRWWRRLAPRFWRLGRLRAEIVERAQRPAPWDEPQPERAPAALARRGPVETGFLAQLCQQALAWHELVGDVTDTLSAYPFYRFGCRGLRADVEIALADLEALYAHVAQIQAIREQLGPVHDRYRVEPDFSPPEAAGGPEDGPARALSALSVGDLRRWYPELVQAALGDRERARRFARVEASAARLTRDLQPDWVAARVAAAGAGAPGLEPVDAVLASLGQAPEVVALDRALADLPGWARRFLRHYRPDLVEAAAREADAAAAREADAPAALEADAVRALVRAWRVLAERDRPAHELEFALTDDSQRAAVGRAYQRAVELAGPAVRARYRARLRAAGADRDQARALRKLSGEARKRRYRRSIRQLIEEYWDSCLRDLKPVWLCSPESVAALFPLASSFDLVILDEASQCPVESALPALVRGRYVLIAGDEKQMPPSHFFASRDDDELSAADDESTGEGGAPSTLLAADSILDVARVAYPGVMLRYHYRSRHEELITFSNHAFYGGRLVTAPPALRQREACEGMRFERVDGYWREQQNRAEAEATAARVIELLGQAGPEGQPLSVGVITFNQKQRALIEALLDDRAAADPVARARLADEWERPATEALFVKNIENVQGDERDVIVFSIGYGRTEEGGRVAARFGPVGLEGGENRLNVAITRARVGIVVLASFEPRELRVDDSLHLGPKLLRRYLDYVYEVGYEGGSGAKTLSELAALMGLQRAGLGGEVSAALVRSAVGARVKEELADALEASGLVVARDFGIGPHRLDLAVRSGGRRGPERWAVGVDCTRFLATADPIERDVTEPAFWQRAGWHIERVSPTSWLERRAAVVDAICERVAPASLPSSKTSDTGSA